MMVAQWNNCTKTHWTVQAKHVIIMVYKLYFKDKKNMSILEVGIWDSLAYRWPL